MFPAIDYGGKNTKKLATFAQTKKIQS
jgi:hypothetical protein